VIPRLGIEPQATPTFPLNHSCQQNWSGDPSVSGAFDAVTAGLGLAASGGFLGSGALRKSLLNDISAGDLSRWTVPCEADADASIVDLMEMDAEEVADFFWIDISNGKWHVRRSVRIAVIASLKRWPHHKRA
jgi:hypothetical protein